MMASVLTSLIIVLLGGVEEGGGPEGEWVLVAQEYEGNPSSPEQIMARGVEISLLNGRFLTTRRLDKTRWHGSYQWDASITPNEFDFTIDEGPYAGKTQLSIYKVDGDTLTLCSAEIGKPRPKGFVTRAGDRQYLQTYKRKKP